jgi:hypothetical protein
MDKIIYTKRRYAPKTISVPVPIIAHSHEIIIPVDVAKKFYPYLTSGKPLTAHLRRELRTLFESSPTVI